MQLDDVAPVLTEVPALQIDGDGKEPWPQRLASPKIILGSVKLQERLSNELVSVFSFANLLLHHAEQEGCITTEELREGDAIARLVTLHQFFVARHLGWSSLPSPMRWRRIELERATGSRRSSSGQDANARPSGH